MPDQNAPQSIIYNSLASGELSPAMYGRTDLAKFHQGAFTMKNFFVDYKGGAKTRPGFQYIGTTAAGGYARLWTFKFSPAIGQSYILVFTDTKLEFIKNPGGPAYPNSSNSGFIISGGGHYSIVTPYVLADLPMLKFSQLRDTLDIVHPAYPRLRLTRISDTSWTLLPLTNIPTIAAPVFSNIEISALPSGSTDPQDTRYVYAASSVSTTGEESFGGQPQIAGPGIDIGSTQGSISLFWDAVPNAAYYKIFKGIPAPGDRLPPIWQNLGFIGYAYGTSFVDSNIVPDFTKASLSPKAPFAIGQYLSYTITTPGSGYDPSTTTLAMAGGGPPTIPPVIYAIVDTTDPSMTGGITGIWIFFPGEGGTGDITVTAATGGGSGFAAVLKVGATAGTFPGVAGIFQQRQMYAQMLALPNGLWGSRTGTRDDFRVTNPPIDSDAIEFAIASPQVTKILWLQSMPGGLVIGTDAGIVQLTGGSASASNPLAVTPSSNVFVPQSYYGSADLFPIVIDYDIYYVQSEGSIIRNLQYNFFVNVYTGTDITINASHLFYPHTIIDWCYQDSPNKVIWAIRDDYLLLSITTLKAQEINGIAWHNSQTGLFESIACVQEGSTDAVYVSVNRNGTRYIERMVTQVYEQADDAWCLDAALSTVPTFPAASLTLSGTTGTVTATASAAVFSSGDTGKVLRAGTGKGVITFVDSTHVSIVVNAQYPFGRTAIPLNQWRLDTVVSSVSGLAHLNGLVVYALVDGLVQGPFTVSGAAITLTTPGSQIVVGLLFQAQVQPLYVDLGGEVTLQGRRKKVTAATIRVKDTARIKFGTSFDKVVEWVPLLSDTNPAEALPAFVPGLFQGDQRMNINQIFNRIGSVAVTQDFPLPATVLALIPEIAQGDTR